MQPKLLQLQLANAIVVINHQMATLQVQVGKKFIDDVLIDGGSRVNIITENLKIHLNLSKPTLEPYNLHMVD